MHQLTRYPTAVWLELTPHSVELGKNGVQKIHPIGKITDEEQKLLDACLPELKKNISAGVQFAQK